MGRIYFKEQKESKFTRWCEEHGADYCEDGRGVWKMPKKVGEVRCAVRLNKDGNINIGEVDEGCDNFYCDSRGIRYFKEEIRWLIIILGILITYKK